ncbi:MAG: flagellar export protein FliJ [Lachnospiraceae bacterium]|nr:flagellar export protein FliJ [Lachnospiraceae bacterium]
MAKFIFSLQNILNIKEKLEEQAKMEFAQARILLDEEEARLTALLERKADYEEEGRRLRDAKLNVQDIIDNKTAIVTIDGYIDLQRLEVKKAEANLELARLKLNEAIKERKTYERLREKAHEEFIREENAREAREVDELVSYKHTVKNKE